MHAENLQKFRRRRIVYRIVLAVGFPMLLLVLVEGGLRLTGFGYRTTYFVPAESSARSGAAVRDNPRFLWSYFPPAMARSPQPVVLARKKPRDTIRIFVLGGSAAMGDPAADFGLARQLEALLTTRFPSRRFEVLNVAVTAINSHTVRRIAEDCVRYDPDFWIIYMGNNEVVGPFGPASVFGAQAPSPSLIQASLAFKSTRLGQAMDWMIRQWRSVPARSWSGLAMFLDQKIGAWDPRLERVYRSFSLNLEHILDLAQQNSITPVLCSVGVNLKDTAPFASMNQPDLSGQDRRDWQSAYDRGCALMEEERFGEAIEALRAAERLDGSHADLQFRLARCLLREGREVEAGDHFTAARDADALRFRADDKLNAIIRRLAGERREQGVRFVDAAAQFNRAAQSGTAGNEFFLDHVHFTFPGNYLLGRLVAHAVAAELEGEPTSLVHPWLTQTECAEWLAYTPWDREEILAGMLRRLQRPPFSLRSNQEASLASLRHRLAGDTAPPASALPLYRTILRERPGDWRVLRRLGLLEARLGRPAEGLATLQRASAEVPHFPDLHYQIGVLQLEAGDLTAARESLQHALELRGIFPQAKVQLGRIEVEKGNPARARQLFHRALENDPALPEAWFQLGTLHEAAEDWPAARADYQKAIENGPDLIEPRLRLGEMLQNNGDLESALPHLEAAAAMDPRRPEVQFLAAETLFSLHRFEAAARYFEAGLRNAPDHAKALYGLGICRIQEGRLEEAITCFRQTLELQPDLIPAHFNLAVALAKTGHTADARSQFQKVLELDPNHKTARDYLHQLSPSPSPRATP